MLRQLDHVSHFPLASREWAVRAAKAIRALEAEVEEVRNSRDDCMRCDRLAGEVERLLTLDNEHHARLAAEVARLAAELLVAQKRASEVTSELDEERKEAAILRAERDRSAKAAEHIAAELAAAKELLSIHSGQWVEDAVRRAGDTSEAGAIRQSRKGEA